MAINLSPNMNLPIPVVGQENGPQWASDLNNSLTILDGHTHAPGSGTPINPAGIAITSDLTFSDNNATNLRSSMYFPQGAPLSLPADIGCVYVSGVDLFYNDVNGVQIRLTQSGNIVGTAGSISGLVSPASATYSAGSSTFIWQSNVLTPANMDAASYIFRNLSASSFGVTVQAPAALAVDYSLVLPSLPPSLRIMTLDASGNIAAPFYIDNSTLQVSANILSVADGSITGGTGPGAKIASATITAANIATGTITGTQIADNSISPTKLTAENLNISASCGTFSTTSGTFVTVLNQAVLMTTQSRPIVVQVQSDNTSNTSQITASGAVATIAFFRDATQLGSYDLNAGQIVPGSSFCIIDFNVDSNLHAYSLQVKSAAGAGTVIVDHIILVVYEL